MTRALEMLLHDPDGRRQAATLNVTPGLSVSGAKVSCLMISRGRRLPAEHAIACYRRQTYPERELVIVSAALDDELAALVAEIGDPSIRLIRAAPATLGELRNISVAHATGDLICQWDDDDLSAPDRIALMAAALGGSQAMACFLGTLTLWWPDRRRLASSGARIWENTMLVRREALPIYAALDLREDTGVGAMIRAHHRITLLAAPESYAYIYHGANAWDAGHFGELFDNARLTVADADYDAEIAALGATMPLAAYAADLTRRIP
ncbi:glycosyltransferase family 2 protein [Sphingobium boeckii]|uniref:Glycosyltransferase involved in cell wall biosynthesis n=1 Tax=Sphingobium boeckii TaxID=1082345 RepID=A0A7W9AIK7_9SPHN|nr:glycosyltransferase [Sphingobium boeckii]MBB5686233.1 glycosyltransferase involved in cell wall biosynthesis [Sphingobium boeckii]